MNIIPKNNYILVRELVRKEDEKKTESGLIIPEEILQEDEVAQGTVIVSASDEYKKDQIVLFHKTLPVDALLKLEGDTQPTPYYFINSKDIVCVVEL